MRFVPVARSCRRTVLFGLGADRTFPERLLPRCPRRTAHRAVRSSGTSLRCCSPPITTQTTSDVWRAHGTGRPSLPVPSAAPPKACISTVRAPSRNRQACSDRRPATGARCAATQHVGAFRARPCPSDQGPRCPAEAGVSDRGRLGRCTRRDRAAMTGTWAPEPRRDLVEVMVDDHLVILDGDGQPHVFNPLRPPSGPGATGAARRLTLPRPAEQPYGTPDVLRDVLALLYELRSLRLVTRRRKKFAETNELIWTFQYSSTYAPPGFGPRRSPGELIGVRITPVRKDGAG
jgi:hypothetical protein